MDLESLTSKQQQQILEEIARIAEHAFRRGFQQGYLVGQGNFQSQTRIPSKLEVAEWRSLGNMNEAIPHPGSGYTHTGIDRDGNSSNSTLDRLDYEIGNCNVPNISKLLQEFYQS